MDGSAQGVAAAVLAGPTVLAGQGGTGTWGVPRPWGRGSRSRCGGLFFRGLLGALAGAAGISMGAESGPPRPGRIAPADAKPLPRPAAARGDAAVTPAGAARPAVCGHCSRRACPRCRVTLADGVHHGACEHGLCPAHCPVRPEVFGFYGTQWRKWPGSGVARASFLEEATPARPPKAEVPKASEESLQPGPADEAATKEPLPPAAAEAAADDPPPAPRDREDPPRAPLPKPFPDVDEGAAVPRAPAGRARRRIPLARELDGAGEPTSIIAVDHDAATEKPAGGTGWRRYVAAAPDASPVVAEGGP